MRMISKEISRAEPECMDKQPAPASQLTETFSMRRFLCDGGGCGREGPESQATPSRRNSNTLASIDDGGKSLTKHHV